MKNKLDYRRYVCGIDLTPRKRYRKHIDALLDANQVLYNKIEIMERTNRELVEELRRLRAITPERDKNGQYKKRNKAS